MVIIQADYTMFQKYLCRDRFRFYKTTMNKMYIMYAYAGKEYMVTLPF